jgi:cell division protein FtsN
MAEPGVHEIQLNAKQLVFMFMAAVVVAVGIFLLGVSVGRGAREATGGGGATEVRVSNPPPAPVVPPPTKPAPGSLGYHDALQAPRPGDTKPQDQPANATPPATPPPAATPPAPQASAPPPATTPATKPQSPATAPAGQGWLVQVGQFRDRANADRILQELKGQGYPAAISVVNGSLNRVRVGPYAQRSEADAVAKKLAKYKPVVTR